MTMLTQENIAVGLFVHQGTILGNRYVQVITEFTDDTVYTEYLQPAPSRAYPKMYWWSAEYNSPKYLVIIPDPARFVWGTPKQARYIMEHDRFGLGKRTYDYCWSAVATDIIWSMKQSGPWKEKIDRKVWQMRDYYVPGEWYVPENQQLRIREARGWRKSDRMFNGTNFWAIVHPNGEREEWTNLRTVLRRAGLWFDDSRYL